MRTNLKTLGVRCSLVVLTCGAVPALAGPLFGLAGARFEGSEPGIGFGFAVDIDGDRIVVGAPDEFTPARRGAVYVFERIDGVWERIARLQAEAVTPTNQFGFAVDLDGDRLLIGAPGRETEGLAYVFEVVGGRWMETARLSGEGIGSRPRFGSSVSLHNNTAVIGMPDASGTGGGPQTGAAVVYMRDGLQWLRTDVLAPTDVEGSQVGEDVVISERGILIGAPGYGDGAIDAQGAVFFYSDRPGGSWQLEDTLVAPDAASGARLGAHIAFGDDRLLAHAAGLPAVYAFESDANGNWNDGTRLDTLISDSDYGAGLAIENETAVIGAPRDGQGEAALLARARDGWDPQSLLPPDFTRTPAYGGACAISKGRVVVGDVTDDALGGGVYVYELVICREPPSITTQPEDAVGCAGDTVSLSVDATGSELGYQWRKGGVQLVDDGRITGSLTPTLTISDLREDDAGLYDVLVGNGCSLLTSFDAEVAIARVTGNPVSILRCDGTEATLSCAVDATDPLFQWERDGVPLIDDDRISGAQTSLLTILDTTDADEGSYACRVMTCTELLTAAATLTVTNGPEITLQPVPMSVCAGYPATFTVEANGDELTYRWSRGLVALSDGGKYSGTHTAALTINPTSGNDSAEYRCAVSNACGGFNSDTVRLLIAGFPPMIAADPEDVTVGVGG